jgi:hypothetical protein
VAVKKTYTLLTELKDKRLHFKATCCAILNKNIIAVDSLTSGGRPVFCADMVPAHFRPKGNMGHIEPAVYNIRSPLIKHGGHHVGQPLDFEATIRPAPDSLSPVLTYDGLYFFKHETLDFSGIPSSMLPADEAITVTFTAEGVPHMTEMLMEYSANYFQITTVNLKTKKVTEHKQGEITPKIVKVWRMLNKAEP